MVWAEVGNGVFRLDQRTNFELQIVHSSFLELFTINSLEHLQLDNHSQHHPISNMVPEMLKTQLNSQPTIVAIYISKLAMLALPQRLGMNSGDSVKFCLRIIVLIIQVVDTVSSVWRDSKC